MYLSAIAYKERAEAVTRIIEITWYGPPLAADNSRAAADKYKQIEPQLVAVHDEERFLTYRSELVRNWEPNGRQTLTFVALERNLIPPPDIKDW